MSDISPDLIDNRNIKFRERFSDFCKYTKNLKIASGYFYVSGFNLVKEDLTEIKDIKIVMGNETDIETAQELEKGYNEKIKNEFIKDLNSIADGDEEKISALKTLHDFIREGRIDVKIYIKEKFHAKAYIFSRVDESIGDVAIVGSSNFTRPGIEGNTELNSIHRQSNDLKELNKWYQLIWDESKPYKDELLKILEESGPYIRNVLGDKDFITPDELLRYLIYEFLYHDVSLFKDVLAEFQKIGVENAKEKINTFNGCIISDSVGLGKTFIGARLLEFYQKHGESVLLIVPASIKENWERELNRKDDSGLRFFDIDLDPSKLKIMTVTELSNYDLRDPVDANRLFELKDGFGVILIDEAHRFRNHGDFNKQKNEYSGNKNYANLMWLKTLNKRYILLTATPLNNSILDLRNIVGIFTTPITLKNNNLEFSDFDNYDSTLRQIKNLEKEKKDSSISKIHELRKQLDKYSKGVIRILEEVMILRTRSDISERYPDLKIQNNKVTFQMAEIKPEKYSFPKTYLPIYENISEFLVKLNVPHIALTNEASGGILAGLYRILLFKRLESSIYSFVQSLERLRKNEEQFLKQIEILGLEKAREQRIAGSSLNNEAIEKDTELTDWIEEQQEENPQKYLKISEKDVIQMIKDDLKSIEKFTNEFLPAIKTSRDEFSYDDAKLTKLKELLKELKTKKVLVFTQYIDTVRYMYHHTKNIYGLNIDCVVGNEESDLGSDSPRNHKIKLFAPKANQYTLQEGEKQIDILISTDALSEGVNLQDASHVINYDLPWNPMRIVQRVGRVDRIGSEQRTTVYNIFPDEELETLLELLTKLKTKIKTISEIVGKENYILSPDEEINPKIIGEKIKELMETDSFKTYEETGRNPLLQQIKTTDDKSQQVLELKALIAEKGLKEKDFKEYTTPVYSIIKNEHRKGVFIMFRIMDKTRSSDLLEGKIKDVILLKDTRTGQILEKTINELSINENLEGLRKDNKYIQIDLDANLKEIENYFKKNVLEPEQKKFTPTSMRIEEKPSKLQTYIASRLRRIVLNLKLEDDLSESDKEQAKKMKTLFSERVLSDKQMNNLKGIFFEENEKSRDYDATVERIRRLKDSEFVRKIRKFYRGPLIADLEYKQKLREPKDIIYKKICWGAFV